VDEELYLWIIDRPISQCEAVSFAFSTCLDVDLNSNLHYCGHKSNNSDAERRCTDTYV
jgi:hypothetical protein